MSEENSRRRYELRKRADDVANTRRRITEATVELHGTVGPARTTISAIAEMAGVQRRTIYRHFPSEDELFAACSTHFWAEHPLPEQAEWGTAVEPRERLATALRRFYAYYPSVADMMDNVYRDATHMDAVARALAAYSASLDGVARELAAGLPGDKQLVRAAVRHALDYLTWRSLVRDRGLSARRAVGLMVTMTTGSAMAVPVD